MDGEPVRQLAGFPLIVFAAAAGASRSIPAPQAFEAGNASSFQGAVAG